MSSRARKLAKRVHLTQHQSSGTEHGCDECRGMAFRQQITRELIVKGLIASPRALVCPVCFASWIVKFGADSEGMATVAFTVPLLS